MEKSVLVAIQVLKFYFRQMETLTWSPSLSKGGTEHKRNWTGDSSPPWHDLLESRATVLGTKYSPQE